MKYRFQSFEKKELLRGHLNLGGKNINGDEIAVTSQYFERNGRPWMSVMGEYHFSRDDRENWQRELNKMAAGGVKIVATYMVWLHHEEERGNIRFDGNLDIRAFLECTRRAGLEVCLRIGPWVHGECRHSGLPDWVLETGCKVRSNDPVYLEATKLWYEAIARETRGFYFPEGGNIIAVQLENELTNNAEHLATLKKLAVEAGIIAPVYTVTGWNSKYGARIPIDEVVPVFGAYPDAPWAKGTAPLKLSRHYAFYTMRNDSAIGSDVIGGDDDGWQLPYERYPFVTCEIGPGMMSTHHRRVLISGLDAYALSLVKLGAGNNLVGYYMYHGGTNPTGKTAMNETKATGSPNDYPVLNYDFDTCLSQYGEVREQYRYLNLLHLFIEDFGEKLAPMQSVAAERFVAEDDATGLRYCMRTDGKSGFIFVNNYQRHLKLIAKPKVELVTTVSFPEISVLPDASFILPFNLETEAGLLEFATAQLICKDENNYIFLEIPGIKPRFKFKDGEEFVLKTGTKTLENLKLIVLSLEEALYLRRLNGKLYLGDGVDLYLEDGEVTAVEPGSFSYMRLCKGSFEAFEKQRGYRPATLEKIVVEQPFEVPEMFAWELEIEDNTRKKTWMKLSADTAEGFVEIDEKYDAAIVFANKKPVADNFYDGKPWRLPAGLICGRECYLVMSELKDDIYLEP